MDGFETDIKLELLHELQKLGLDKIDTKSLTAIELGYFLGQLDSAECREKYCACTDLVKDQVKKFLGGYHDEL